MISLKPEDFESVKFLLKQSLKGNHLAFDMNDLKPLLKDKEVFKPITCEQELTQLESEIKHFFTLQTYSEKKNYFKILPKDKKIRILKTYFNVVENLGFEQNIPLH